MKSIKFDDLNNYSGEQIIQLLPDRNSLPPNFGIMI